MEAAIEAAEERDNVENCQKDTMSGDDEHERDHCGTSNENGELHGNPGWADAMARILGKELPEDKPAVLVKYKKAKNEKKRKREEHAKKKLITQEKQLARERNHVKPTVANDDKERGLRRIATKGVVKLFNAVNKHQKELESKLKSAPTETKKAKVLKSVSKTGFLDMLKNNSNGSVTTTNTEESSEDRISRWNILREDFMMGGKMKDWDKDDDDVDYDDEDDKEVIVSDNDESE